MVRHGTAGIKSAVIAAAIAALALAAAEPARAQFLEPDVVILKTLTAEAAGDGFGWVGERVGDINGDGAAEYIIGALRNAAGGTLAGRAYLYNGADGSLLHVVTGDAFNRIGFSVAGLGDVDGDGIPDYATSGPGSFGAPGPQPGRLIVLSGADHSVILDVAGPGNLTFFGYDMNAAGDVNGDGHADIVVGAPLDGTGGTQAGSVHVISGADGSTLWRADGLGAFNFLGVGVSGVDDLDGDGLPDVVGSGFAAGNRGVGEAYVYSGADGSIQRVLKPKQQAFVRFGEFFVHNAGDTNADGVGEIYIGAFADSTTGPGAGAGYLFDGAVDDRHIFYGESAGDGFGMGRGAGDVDGDGRGDLLTGAYLHSSAANQGGKAYVWSGRNKMLLRTMTGTTAGHQLGFDVASLGDVDGDGLIDFLITGVDVAYVVAGNPDPTPHP